MEKVLITGGSGLIGRALSKILNEEGYQTVILSRKPGKNKVVWHPEKMFIEDQAFDGINHIIHLAGENIADKRWTRKRKKAILDSRINTTELIFDEVRKRNIRLKSFVSASAIGFYGSIISQDYMSEFAPNGSDFLAEVCKKWEDAASKFNYYSERVVIFRTGIVLTKGGGFLKKILTPAKFGISAVFGSGKQFLSWIHLDDLCNIYLYAIKNVCVNGVFNAVSPNPTDYIEFSKVLGKAIKTKQLILKIPSVFVKLFFGELASVLLTGTKVSADKIKTHGYNFKYPILEDALKVEK